MINAAIGFAQEYRVERALAALKRLVPAQTVVIPTAGTSNVDSDDLVPGDLVVLDAGAQIPADLRLVDAGGIRTGEATLTGEVGRSKSRRATLADADLALGDRTNMAFKGTTVTYGRGRGIVVATGMATELGKIAGAARQAASEPQTPLQKRLARSARLASSCSRSARSSSSPACSAARPTLLMFMTALSLAVAAIPEALPASVTSRSRSAPARWPAQCARPPAAAVETLGSVTFICADKTGTLTAERDAAPRRSIAGGRWRRATRLADSASRRRCSSRHALSNDAATRRRTATASATRPRSRC